MYHLVLRGKWPAGCLGAPNPTPPPHCCIVLQEVLASFGMYADYKWAWAGLGFMAGTYLLFGGAVCAAFAATPVSRMV